MRRILRYSFNAVTVLSLLLCLAVAAVWVRSYRRCDVVTFVDTDAGKLYQALGPKGHIQLIRFHGDVTPFTGRHRPIPRYGYDSGAAIDVRPLPFTFLGIGWRHDHKYPQVSLVSVIILPFGYLLALFAALPAVRLYRRVRRKKRFGPGHCQHCGYDLRATPGRCPECGAVPAAEGMKC